MLGDKIKSMRIRFGLTMEEFGLMFNPIADKSLVSKWESNASSPNNKRLKRIAELGNISVSELLMPERTMNNQLKDNLRKCRGSRTKSQVAKELGMTVGGYSNWEYGNREPCIDMLIKLADYYSVTVDELLRGDM